MNNYEGMFIINPTLSDEITGQVVNTIKDEIKKNKGEIVEEKQIGRQHLAFPIKKFRDGFYLLLFFRGEGDLIGKINSKYRINDNILRSLILKKKEFVPVEKS